ncbi:hypothetical protein PR048_026497 [Dryococelus australis]|uniref:Uncharacterized protein n=1 Tax=Dryococelus australis TaxID=614101 RepID=A0ABQ9GLH0_9NEOP|nr:hypothetical protein PR048_026497 [Dryococelus australis]
MATDSRMSIKLPKPLIITEGVATNIMKKSLEIQVATFMTLIGPDAADIYNTEENSITVIKAKFDAEMFNMIMQTEEQPFDNFLTSVINQDKNCEFQKLTNSLLCDKIVVGNASDYVNG